LGPEAGIPCIADEGPGQTVRAPIRYPHADERAAIGIRIFMASAVWILLGDL